MAKFAAYDDDGIWGVGDTQEQARAEAEGYLKDVLAGTDEEETACNNLKTAPMSDDLLRAVLELDGCAPITDVMFSVDDDGTLVLDNQDSEGAPESEQEEAPF